MGFHRQPWECPLIQRSLGIENYHPRVGDVWRKAGPCAWVKVIGTSLRTDKDFDDGVPGVSVLKTNINGNCKKTPWFYQVGSPAEFAFRMVCEYRVLVPRLTDVVNLLNTIQLDPVRKESQVGDAIEKVLTSAGIPHRKEVKIGPGSRVDFLTDCGVAIEVKKGKPNTKAVAKQIERYAESESVKALVLATERGLITHIHEANGKPVKYVAFTRNWGISI